MRYPDEEIFPPITHGFLITYQQYLNLLISPDIPIEIKKPTNFLIIYATSSVLSRITCYPISFNEVYKVKIEFETLNPDNMHEVSVLMKIYNTIHTTGISEKKGQIIVENYISPIKTWNDALKLVEKIKNLKKIKQCSIEQVQLAMK